MCVMNSKSGHYEEKMLLNFLFLAMMLVPFCISVDTITLNQSLVDGDILLSKEGNFALGFFSPGNSSSKYLGIWYHKLPGQVVVWVANRGDPINGSLGVLSISPDENLVLYNNKDQKFPLWSTNVQLEVTDAAVAQLLDSGNLILFQNESKIIVWQSFDYPTDTMLPGMKLGLDRTLGLNRFLTSWTSKDDPKTGECSFKLDPTGSPQFFLYKGSTKYWRSIPWPWTRAALIYRLESIYNSTFDNNRDGVYYVYLVDESVITRSVLDKSGVLQRLTWDNSSRQWQESWSTKSYIYGYCGAFSLYDANNVYNFECSCLPGYEPKFLKDWNLRLSSGGCVRKRQQSTSLCQSGEGFIKVTQVKVPDTSIAALMNTSRSSKECEQICLRNCSCMAFAILDIGKKGIGCLTWYGELMDTMKFNEGYDMYVRADAVEIAENAMKKRSFFKKKKMLAIAVLSVALTIFLIILTAYLWLRKKKKIEGRMNNKRIKKLVPIPMPDVLLDGEQPPDFPFFNIGTIVAATNNFSPANKLGQGGFGVVYKGLLPDGQEIAVKRLSHSSGQGIEELKNEVVLISRLQHRNLVKLIGCCIQKEEQMLIYEYLSNKSLDAFIFDQRKRLLLDWSKRFDIIIGIARGILYLHHDSRLRIVHRDLKTSNVLLDAEMNPKISDFGMARIFKGDQVQDKTNRVAGTYGYMSPEYVLFGKFSIKSDIFSFGVVLLEIISGKKSSSSYEDDPSLSLIGHVWDLWRKDRVLDIVDSSLTGSHLPAEVFRCIQIALLCVQHDATDRPTMPAVVLMLNGETSLPSPKQPAFVSKRDCNGPSLSSTRRPCSVNEVTVSTVKAR